MITSKDNQYCRMVGDLQKKKFREEYGLFPAEGKRLIADLISAGLKPHLLLYTEKYKDIAFLETVSKFCDSVFSVSDRIFTKISDTVNSQGIVAVFPLICPEFSSYFPGDNDFLLILNKITDPGNLGTIVRSAAAAGVSALIMEKGCVELFNPKVIRSTMGTVARIPVFYGVGHKEVTDFLRRFNFNCYIADMNHSVSYHEIKIDCRSAVVLGNESLGIGEEWRTGEFHGTMIPMENGVESLNVAMAAGVIAFDVARRKNAEKHEFDLQE